MDQCYTTLNLDQEDPSRWLPLRPASVETFQSTMNKCFVTVVEDILGRTVKTEMFLLLSRNGIGLSEVSSKFDDVLEVLTSAFGDGARVLVFKTVTELY